jgi:hypothetical protein
VCVARVLVEPVGTLLGAVEVTSDEKTKCYTPQQVLDAVTNARLAVADPDSKDTERLQLIATLDAFDATVERLLRIHGPWTSPAGSAEDW